MQMPVQGGQRGSGEPGVLGVVGRPGVIGRSPSAGTMSTPSSMETEQQGALGIGGEESEGKSFKFTLLIMFLLYR